MAQSSEKVIEVSYELSLLIAKENKSKVIGEALVKPLLLKVADVIRGTNSRQKLSKIPVSDTTVKPRIYNKIENIIKQVVLTIK